MASPVTLATAISTAVSSAQARGITDAEHLSRIRAETIDFWQSRLNATYSGEPSGSLATN
jgi:hypothetical protein